MALPWWQHYKHCLGIIIIIIVIIIIRVYMNTWLNAGFNVSTVCCQPWATTVCWWTPSSWSWNLICSCNDEHHPTSLSGVFVGSCAVYLLTYVTIPHVVSVTIRDDGENRIKQVMPDTAKPALRPTTLCCYLANLTEYSTATLRDYTERFKTTAAL